MDKQGQVTVFMVVGLVLVAVFVVTFVILSYSQRSSLKEEVKVPWTIPRQQVKDFAENCLEDQLLNTILLVAAQGGYYNPPAKHFSISLLATPMELEIPIYSASDFPAVAVLEEEIKEGFQVYSEVCFDFRKLSYSAQADSLIDMSVTVSPHSVFVLLQRPVHIQSGSAEAVVELFEVRIESPVGMVHQAARSIVEQSSCISCLTDLVPAGFSLDETWIPSDDIMLSIKTISDENFAFNFAEEIAMEEAPVLFSIPPLLQAQVGRTFAFQIQPSRDNVLFDMESDLLAISREGIITFMPEEEHKGKHTFVVFAFADDDVYAEEGVLIVE